MTPADLDFDALEKTATTAAEWTGPRPWSVSEPFLRGGDGPTRTLRDVLVSSRPRMAVAENCADAVAEFIAAANPKAVLALLALARRTVEAERERDDARDALNKKPAPPDLAALAAATTPGRGSRPSHSPKPLRRPTMSDDIRDRIATIASEAFGPFPVQTVEDDLTAIERGIGNAHGYGEEWRSRAEKAERERDEARVELSDKMTKLDDHRSLCGELLESTRLASTTSDGHRDAHAAFQRWAAVHAPDAIGDEQKREAIDRLLRAPDAPARSALTRLLWNSVADDAECTCYPTDPCPECQAMGALGLGRWRCADEAERALRGIAVGAVP